ncbi:hypothetical protein ACVWY0_000938 [Arthrobacter sp. UYNi723]
MRYQRLPAGAMRLKARLAVPSPLPWAFGAADVRASPGGKAGQRAVTEWVP